GNAVEHLTGRVAQPPRPHLADQVVVASNSSRSDDHRLRAHGELADLDPRARAPAFDSGRFENSALDSVHRPIAHGQGVDSMPESEHHPPASNRRPKGATTAGPVPQVM